MPLDLNRLLALYLPRRRLWEALVWTVGLLVTALANATTVWMDYQREELPMQFWRPATWEFSSAVVILALVPAVVLFERWRPLRRGSFRANLPWHVLGSLVFSLLHVVGMVGLRKAVYALMGATYDFGDWPRELFYEYLKDVRGYAFILAVLAFYRLALLRLQGEARLLVAPEAGSLLEPIERPERFLVRKLGAEFLVPARDIDRLEAAENYVNLHVGGKVYPLRSTMAAVEKRLDPQRFVRVHRSHIVNLDRIERIEPLDTGDARVWLRDGTRVPCSRTCRDALRQVLGQPVV